MGQKEAVASIVVPAADRWGIKTFPCRGFTSLTSTWEAAETFKEAIRHGKMPLILYLGDRDLKGKQCDDTIRNHFALHGLAGEVQFRLVAILPEHIEHFNLPTRPPKFKGDPAECVEIDTFIGRADSRSFRGRNHSAYRPGRVEPPASD